MGHSREDNQDSEDDDEETSDEDDDEENEQGPKQISVSLDAEDEFDEGRMQSAQVESIEDEFDRYARGQTFVSMELQLIAMNDKVAALIQEVNELKQRNVELETSKLQLIESTANAMNDCKRTIKHLSV